mgnify:CR=1 FL=1
MCSSDLSLHRIDVRRDAHALGATPPVDVRRRAADGARLPAALRSSRGALERRALRLARLLLGRRALLDVALRDPQQLERLQQLKVDLAHWGEEWSLRSQNASAPAALVTESDRTYDAVVSLLSAFDAREQELADKGRQLLLNRRRLFFLIVGSYALLSCAVLGFVMIAAKRQLLDPLTELTESTHRIEEGDLDAAHQTLRDDEIGILINSFGKMAQAVRVRERELALALNDSRELGDDEDLYRQALDVLKSTRRASTSMIQRRLRIGYNRAARIMDLMEEKGIVGPENGSSPREIIADLDKL